MPGYCNNKSFEYGAAQGIWNAAAVSIRHFILFKLFYYSGPKKECESRKKIWQQLNVLHSVRLGYKKRRPMCGQPLFSSKPNPKNRAAHFSLIFDTILSESALIKKREGGNFSAAQCSVKLSRPQMHGESFFQLL